MIIIVSQHSAVTMYQHTQVCKYIDMSFYNAVEFLYKAIPWGRLAALSLIIIWFAAPIAGLLYQIWDVSHAGLTLLTTVTTAWQQLQVLLTSGWSTLVGIGIGLPVVALIGALNAFAVVFLHFSGKRVVVALLWCSCYIPWVLWVVTLQEFTVLGYVATVVAIGIGPISIVNMYIFRFVPGNIQRHALLQGVALWYVALRLIPQYVYKPMVAALLFFMVLIAGNLQLIQIMTDTGSLAHIFIAVSPVIQLLFVLLFVGAAAVIYTLATPVIPPHKRANS